MTSEIKREEIKRGPSLQSSSPRRLKQGAVVVLASHNTGKLKEFSALLAHSGIIVRAASEWGLPEPAETETSFEGNARLKALAAARATGLPALADDSGFCVAVLGGAPGVYSARWAGPERDMAKAMTRVHQEMTAKGVSFLSHPDFPHSGNTGDKAACFEAALCLAWPDGVCRVVNGLCRGEVIWPPRGQNGHGYDPLFVPQEEMDSFRRGHNHHAHARSFAEMPESEKNRYSHRARAIRIFLKDCIE